ncbi:hypothetical protein AAHC03_017224 [Spirometra sp. Aus1]|nr:unnamed protein product [Spirometra erinaceieuropaei]
MTYDLRRELLDDADPHFRTRIHDSTIEAKEILKKSPDFSPSDRVTVPKQTDITPISGIPDEQIQSRVARIYMPTRPATQSGTFGTRMWRIDFDNQERWENPLMGWASTGDPLSNVSMKFPTAEAAVEYCNSQGWKFFVEEPKKTHIVPKSYANNFSWDKRTRRATK